MILVFSIRKIVFLSFTKNQYFCPSKNFKSNNIYLLSFSINIQELFLIQKYFKKSLYFWRMMYFYILFC